MRFAFNKYHWPEGTYAILPEVARFGRSMAALKTIQAVFALTAILSAFVVAFWIFPRLFLAQYSPAIWQSIRRHPTLHLIWGVAGLAAIYLFFQMARPQLAT